MARDNQTKNTISELVSTTAGNNVLLTTPDEINQEIVKHFENIFKREFSPDETFAKGFLDSITNVYTPTQELTAPFTLLEISSVLSLCKKNKSPGLDGLPYEFYQVFWDVVGPHFLDMLRHVIENRLILPSQSKALIRLLPKNDNPNKITEFRPISLLNSDYKIIASVLATRLKRSLGDSIGESQKGGIPGRFLHDNLCLYRDLIQYVEERSAIPIPCNMGAAIISVDLEKAYDLVERNILWKIMKTMGYPTDFIAWLQTLYNSASMIIQNGNCFAGELSDVQSIRQGCPLSMHLFAIYIEPLLSKINQTLKGVVLQKHRVAARALVDDVAIFASNLNDVKLAGELLEGFCAWTGAKVNKQKTKALCLGGLVRNLDWPLPWLETTDSLKLLGISFSKSIIETSRREWEKSLNKIKGMLVKNRNRNFTIFGRVQFIKTYVLPLVIHKAQVLPCPKMRADKMLNAMTSFVWAHQLEWPDRGNTHRPILQGGLGIPNPFQFFRSLFVRSIFKSFIGPESPERSALRFWLAWPLRKQFDPITSSTISALRPPKYITDIVPVIQTLMTAGLFTTITMASHRRVYNHLIEPLYGPGHIEKTMPRLNWPKIWKWVKHLHGAQRDIIWLFNHRLLPTRSRVHLIQQQGTNLCLYCKKKEETDQHMTIECEKKKPLVRWLERKLRWLQCPVRLRDSIRGHIGNCPHPDTARAIIANYVEIIWVNRRRVKVPTIDELDSIWRTLLEKCYPA